MARLVAAFVAIGLLALAAAWLADRPGAVALDWQGFRIETTLAVAVIAVAALMLAAVVAYRIWHWIVLGSLGLRAARDGRQRRRGQLALTQGMVAVAAGDAAAALRFARQAETQLDDLPLTMLLSAQAAQLNGDDMAAKRYFASMLERPEMEFLGLRGLMVQATRAGNDETALTIARRAYRLRPATPWVLSALFDLETRAAHWLEAGRVVDHAVKHRVFNAEEGRRRMAITLYQRARRAQSDGKPGEAAKLDIESHGLGGDFVPAAVEAAKALLAQGKRRRAVAMVEQAWARAPHPALAELHAATFDAEPPARRLQRAEKLASLRPDDAASRQHLAAAAIVAERWALAREQLAPLADRDDADAAVCRLMAALEEAERGPAYARTWLERIAAAPPALQWVCRSCERGFAAWSVHCHHCAAFDSLTWRHPDPHATVPLPAVAPLDAIRSAAAPLEDAAAQAEAPGAPPPTDATDEGRDGKDQPPGG
jgi:HemY protein